MFAHHQNHLIYSLNVDKLSAKKLYQVHKFVIFKPELAIFNHIHLIHLSCYPISVRKIQTNQPIFSKCVIFGNEILNIKNSYRTHHSIRPVISLITDYLWDLKIAIFAPIFLKRYRAKQQPKHMYKIIGFWSEPLPACCSFSIIAARVLAVPPRRICNIRLFSVSCLTGGHRRLYPEQVPAWLLMLHQLVIIHYSANHKTGSRTNKTRIDMSDCIFGRRTAFKGLNPLSSLSALFGQFHIIYTLLLCFGSPVGFLALSREPSYSNLQHPRAESPERASG